jgi:outer membrane receptor protein involved in Fe transport
VTLANGYRAVTPNRDAILNLGGGEEFQDKGQKGWGFQDDLTFTSFDWHGAHTVKTGFKYKQIEINAFEQQPYNPQFFYDVTQDPTIPFIVQFGAPLPGLPERNVQSDNRQYGIYIQDDWEATDKLLLNLGVRYDYEETPAYLNYVTPADVIAGFNAVDTSPGAAPGQTYAQSLALGGVDVNKFISTGNNRSAFDGAIQPRLGFSYDFSADESFVLFGGAGPRLRPQRVRLPVARALEGHVPALRVPVQHRRARVRRGYARQLPGMGSGVAESSQSRGAGRGEPEPGA